MGAQQPSVSAEEALRIFPRKRVSTRRYRKAVEGYLLISPWIVGFIVFTLGPMIASLYLSLNDYAIVKPPLYVGLGNYERAFFHDRLFWSSMGRTLVWALATVPLGLAGSLLAAILLDQNLKATTVFRTFFFLPSLTPIVASTVLWRWILNSHLGPLNQMLRYVGIVGPRWLADPNWAIPSLVLISLWGSIGGNRMIIFLAGLQGVPLELHDAAQIDGANVFQRFWNVTLPMVSPTILFNLIMGIIGALSVFAMAYVATEGGPAYATWFYVLHLFNQAFSFMNMGYACALAWIFFIVVLALTGMQLKLSGRWVYYAGG